MKDKLLEVLGLLTIGAVAGALSQTIPTKTERLKRQLKAVGETEMVEMVEKVEAGADPEDIIAEMSPAMRQRWYAYGKEKKHGQSK